MAGYQPVRNSLRISMDIADILEKAAPHAFNGANRAKTIRECNDVLHDRSDMSIEMLYDLLEQTCGDDGAGAIGKIKRDVNAFRHQKMLRTWRYTMVGDYTYHYKMWNFDPRRPLKNIDQRLFDDAAEHGLPPDFFTESYFDHVTIYCMPDNADCSFSQFQSCDFSVCGIRGAVFDHATLYDTDFHSSLLMMVNFTETSIAHSRFWDCDLTSVSFQDARLKSCLTVDCNMDRIDFLGATLDGSSYGRITARNIKNLPNAVITQGGATHEEVRRLQVSTFHELGVPMFPVKRRPAPNRDRKKPAPER